MSRPEHVVGLAAGRGTGAEPNDALAANHWVFAIRSSGSTGSTKS
ncbi:hypothetical protein [Streptomyces sp. NPDC058330]